MTDYANAHAAAAMADKQKHREQVTLLFIYVTDDIIIVKYDGVVHETSLPVCRIRQHY